MSTALGTDLKSASIQVGKALQDPILGITALRRVGVNFNEEQQELIKTMVETGDVIGAQKYILQELATEFGGSALAASRTFEGQTIQLKNEIGNLGEAIGDGLLPELTQAVSDIKEMTRFITDNIETIKKWGNVITWIVNPFYKLSKITGGWFRDLVMGKDNIDAVVESGSYMPDMLEDIVDPALEASDAMKELSDSNNDFLSFTTSLGDFQQDYAKDHKAATDDLLEAQEELNEAVRKYGSNSDEAFDVREKVEDAKLALDELQAKWHTVNQEMLFGLVEEQLKGGPEGLTNIELDALLQIRKEMGLITDEEIIAAEKMWELAQAIVAGVEASEALKANMYETSSFIGFPGMTPTGGSQKRDSGGPGIAGQPYMIGTGAQPEMFVPSTNGTFIPNADEKMGGTTYNIVVNNPKKEAAENSIRRSLKNLSYIGVAQ
jgi:hypothetical protein